MKNLLLSGLLLLTGCATTSQVPTGPTDIYIVTDNPPTYFSPSQSAKQTSIHFTHNQPIHVIRRKQPNWVAFSHEGKMVYITQGFTSPTPMDPSTLVKTSAPVPTTPSYSVPASGSHTIQTGPRGGRYYINSNGNKTYIKHK